MPLPPEMPRKPHTRSLFRRDRPLDRSTAWVCLLTNQFVTPGVGSIIAGRVWFGLVQVAIASAGFCLVMVWFVHLFKVLMSESDVAKGMRPYAWQGKLGLLLFFIGWLLALMSSVAILRQARRSETATSPPPLRPPG